MHSVGFIYLGNLCSGIMYSWELIASHLKCQEILKMGALPFHAQINFKNCIGYWKEHKLKRQPEIQL